MWQCPLCQTPLTPNTPSWQCENGHVFDQAKSGYVNLLPVQNKRSKQPGDDKDMLRARKVFHQERSYEPLMDKMVECITTTFATQQSMKLYDAGCGEGSYLDFIGQKLSAKGYSVTGAGSDIAKVAVELAAKAYKQWQFVVASSVSLPIVDAALDCIIQVFAPGSTKEYHRVLKSNGILLTVDPGPNHLSSLKQRVYDEAELHNLPSIEREGFTLINQEHIGFDVQFQSSAHCLALLKMTPYYWKMDKQKLAHLTSTLSKINAEFVISQWKKCD